MIITRTASDDFDATSWAMAMDAHGVRIVAVYPTPSGFEVLGQADAIDHDAVDDAWAGITDGTRTPRSAAGRRRAPPDR